MTDGDVQKLDGVGRTDTIPIDDAGLLNIATNVRKAVLPEIVRVRGVPHYMDKLSTPLANMLYMICDVECSMVQSDLTKVDQSPVGTHYWVKLSDGRVLDPGFDLFDPTTPVYLGPSTQYHVE